MKINAKPRILTFAVLMLGIVVAVLVIIVISKPTAKKTSSSGKAYYRCVLNAGENPGYARCATISAPPSCYPAYKILSDGSIDVSSNNNAATCEGFEPDKVSYYDQQGHYIKTTSWNGEL